MSRSLYYFPEKGSDAVRAEYQNATAAWAIERLVHQDQSGVLLCDPVGNGKTWEAILSAINLAHHRPARRVLIIAGKSELSQKWSREIANKDSFAPIIAPSNCLMPPIFRLQKRASIGWDGAGRSHLYLERKNDGAERAGQKDWVSIECRSRIGIELLRDKFKPRGIWIISDFALSVMVEKWPEDLRFDVIVYDECHHARKRTGNRPYRSFCELRRNNPSAKVIGLTATPAGAKAAEDTINLIETICLPSKSPAAPPDPCLEKLATSIAGWFSPSNKRDWPRFRRELTSRLGQFIARTPNLRGRHYYLTGEAGTRIKGSGDRPMSALPIPDPFGEGAITREDKLDDQDLASLTALQASLILNRSDGRGRSGNVYPFMTAGLESIKKLFNKGKNPVAHHIQARWLERRDAHPKTQRLINFARAHFDPKKFTVKSDKGPEVPFSDRGKLLIFCGVKAVVQSPHWRIEKGHRTKLRETLKTKIETHYKKTGQRMPRGLLQRFLGKKASSAEFTRALRVLTANEMVFNKEHESGHIDHERVERLLLALNPGEILKALRSNVEGLGFNDSFSVSMDQLRDEILIDAFSLKGHDLSVDDEKRILVYARDHLSKYWPLAFGDEWLGLKEEDRIGKPSVRAATLLRGLFLNNHALLLEAYRIFKTRPVQSDRTKGFVTCYCELLLAVKTQLASDPLFKLKKRGNGRDNPLTHPGPAVRTVTGDVSAGNLRNRIIRQFVLPINPCALVCTEVATEGIDLHNYCWDVVLYTLDWVPSGLEQKIGRIDRDRAFPKKSALEELYAKDPRFKKDTKDVIRVHFMILPETYDERMLYAVNRRATEERSLFMKDAGSFDDDVGDRRESIDLRPVKKLAS